MGACQGSVTAFPIGNPPKSAENGTPTASPAIANQTRGKVNVNIFSSPIELTPLKPGANCSWSRRWLSTSSPSPGGTRTPSPHSLLPKTALHPLGEGWDRSQGREAPRECFPLCTPSLGTGESLCRLSLEQLPRAPQLSSPDFSVFLEHRDPFWVLASGEPLSCSPCCHPKAAEPPFSIC